MGKVSEELISLIRKQIDDHGIVVWYDPEEHYRAALDRFEPDDVEVLAFEESYLELRRRLEPFLECLEDGRLKTGAPLPPRVLVYVPRARHENRYALIEAERAGVVVEPGAHPWRRNTRLRVLAERVFGRVAPDQAAEIGRKIETGALNLDDLDRIGEESGDLGALRLVFPSTAPGDITLGFLSSDGFDAAVDEKQAIPELARLLYSTFGFEFPDSVELGALRSDLARKLLLTDFVSGVEAAGAKIAELDRAGLSGSERHRGQARAVAHAWRSRMDLRTSYVSAARSVESETGVGGMEVPPSALTRVETFPFLESRLQAHAAELIVKGAFEEAIDLAAPRRTSVWSSEQPTHQLRWLLLEASARLHSAVKEMSRTLKPPPADPEAFVESYCEGRTGGLPWCGIDTHHRHLERLWSSLELSLEEDAVLEGVMAKSRHAYTHAVSHLAGFFSRALEGSGWKPGRFPRQGEVFSKYVKPVLAVRRTAYVLVDSLRYEMALELVEGLAGVFAHKVTPVTAQPPGLTPVGMAALMPGAEKGIELAEKGGGGLVVRIDGVSCRDRAARVAHLRASVEPKVVADLKLNDLMKPKRKLRDELAAVDLALVTSQEIDRLGEESAEDEEVRRYMDEVLEKLRGGIRRLAAFGFESIVVAADHGHLFGEAIDTGQKMAPPGGQTLLLHRRVWIGRGGRSGPGYLRVKASELGLGGDFELAFPRSLGCFKSPGGGLCYFHGGISLQEMVVPLVTLETKVPVPAAEPGAAVVSLDMERGRVTNRFFTVSLTYRGGGLFAGGEKRVRIDLRSGSKEVGRAAAAGYGFAEGTGEVLLRRDTPNVVTLLLTETEGLRSLSLAILDAATGVELAGAKNLEVDLAD